MLCLSAYFIFTSCDKDDENQGGSSISKIEVSINNNDLDDDITEVRAVLDESNGYVIASCEYINGKFILDLPPTVEEKYLYPFSTEEMEEDFPVEIKISDPNAKTTSIMIMSYDESDNHLGYFHYEKYINNDDIYTETETEVVYADRNVSLTGSFSVTEEGVTVSCKVSAHLKKGWNYVYMTFSETEKSLSLEMTTTEPSGMKWEYYSKYTYKSAQVKSADFDKKFKSLQMFKK